MDNVEKALRDQGYKVKVAEGNLVLRRKGADTAIFICSFLAIPVLMIGYYAHFTIILFGIGLLLAPWIFRRWQYPPRVIFASQGIQLSYGPFSSQKREIPLEHITELQLERIVKPSDVSPFMEGSDDFIYNYLAVTDEKRFKLLRLLFRVDDQEAVEKIRSFLLKYLKHLKSEN